MKKVNIPIFQTVIRIYNKDERVEFEDATGHKMQEDYYGCCCDGSIWIGENNIGACYHEATHFADWLIQERLQCKVGGDLWGHTELRAYIVQWVGDKVREYCCE